jgi:hypothetical protein
MVALSRVPLKNSPESLPKQLGGVLGEVGHDEIGARAANFSSVMAAQRNRLRLRRLALSTIPV